MRLRHGDFFPSIASYVPAAHSVGTGLLAPALLKLDLQRSTAARPISRQLSGLLFIPGLNREE